MKSMCGGGNPIKRGVATPAELLKYAMSVPGVVTTVSGIDSYDVFLQNLRIAEGFAAMSAAEMHALEVRVRAISGDGRLEVYKSTKLYDDAEGRKQHGFPDLRALPA